MGIDGRGQVSTTSVQPKVGATRVELNLQIGRLTSALMVLNTKRRSYLERLSCNDDICDIDRLPVAVEVDAVKDVRVRDVLERDPSEGKGSRITTQRASGRAHAQR